VAGCYRERCDRGSDKKGFTGASESWSGGDQTGRQPNHRVSDTHRKGDAMPRMNRARTDLGGIPRGGREAREADRMAGRDRRAARASAGTARSAPIRTGKMDTSGRLVWERSMRRLRVSTRLLGAILLALLARMILIGATLMTAMTSAIIAVLVIASVLPTRMGKRLEPQPTPPTRAGGR